MKLAALVDDPGLAADPALLEREIAGLTADSRKVEPGFVFAALPGTKADGRTFIADAIAKGAAAILAAPDMPGAGPFLRDANPRRRLALMAARFYGTQPATVVAVTGTSGKTSTASYCQQIWAQLGHKSASLGTLGIRGPGVDRYGSLTTPDPVALHADLAALAKAGITHLAMEASSHGLDQFRLDGVRLSAGGFTNLARDHLDYHPTIDAYRAAKWRLFGDLLPKGAAAVVNADSPEFPALRELCAQRGLALLPYGRATEAAGLQLLSVEPQPGRLALSFRFRDTTYRTSLALAGTFQAWNALCALGLVLSSGAPPGAAADALGSLRGAPGRMELAARHPNGAPIYVDYAHKPDALEAVLTEIRPQVEGKLAVVFGCGGDRDRGKRPIMGEIASRLADMVIVTDDNPRSEEPAAIRAAILAAAPGAREIG
ncbi:MAG: UDP-N-acetylmuramoyl-L-alanyl-D-glutamate--2,6-diaminopimelate ligase, partial [Rhodospirillaceae bacterium]|nr:UDP-N-acetylmuramoyl-L-alanyl-D-glutamate--2,6-diaminopimelate ligase [Rhodospirillaceae bacterium]